MRPCLPYENKYDYKKRDSVKLKTAFRKLKIMDDICL